MEAPFLKLYIRREDKNIFGGKIPIDFKFVFASKQQLNWIKVFLTSLNDFAQKIDSVTILFSLRDEMNFPWIHFLGQIQDAWHVEILLIFSSVKFFPPESS